MLDYSNDEELQKHIDEMYEEYVPEYRNVLILDEENSIVRMGTVFPKESMEPLFMAELCFHVLPNGGLECIKDRFNEYKHNTVWFGL
jgi:hypothetical protein